MFSQSRVLAEGELDNYLQSAKIFVKILMYVKEKTLCLQQTENGYACCLFTCILIGLTKVVFV